MIDSKYEPNPPWVNRIVSKRWEAIKAVSPKVDGYKALPYVVYATARGKNKHFDPLGCGYYGCVMPSEDNQVVFKITSDASEAAFVAAATELPDWPAGMIRYYGIYELPDKYKRRRTFVLWRQIADNIGEWVMPPDWDKARYIDRYGARSLKEFQKHLQQFLLAARKMREQLKRAKDPADFLRRAQAERGHAWRVYVEGNPYREIDHYGSRLEEVQTWHKGPLAFELRRLLCKNSAELMWSTHASYLVGGALDYYLDQGMLLADVHYNNIGEAVPEDHESWELVITDPGHMVPLDEKWLAIEVPKLPGV